MIERPLSNSYSRFKTKNIPIFHPAFPDGNLSK